jgi:hypothetical protein
MTRLFRERHHQLRTPKMAYMLEAMSMVLTQPLCAFSSWYSPSEDVTLNQKAAGVTVKDWSHHPERRFSESPR